MSVVLGDPGKSSTRIVRRGTKRSPSVASLDSTNPDACTRMSLGRRVRTEHSKTGAEISIQSASSDIFSKLAQKWVGREIAWYSKRIAEGQIVDSAFGQGFVKSRRQSDGICEVLLMYGTLFCHEDSLSVGPEISTGYVPIDNEGRKVVSKAHLERAGKNSMRVLCV